MATLYNLKCPECGKEFQFKYSEINSFSDLGIVFRCGPHSFSVKCSQCRKRTRLLTLTGQTIIRAIPNLNYSMDFTIEMYC